MNKVPRLVRAWLLMVGYCVGLVIGVFFITLVTYPSNYIIWGLVLAGSIGVVYWIDFKHRDMLVKWLPYFETKEEEKEG